MNLSHSGRMICDVHPHPWRKLADDWPHVDVRYERLPSHRWGVTRWMSDGTVHIALNDRLNQVERRCTIAHGLHHLARGMPCGTLRAGIEARVIAETARYLLPDLDRIGRTLAVYDLRTAAEELWVTRRVLIDRLNGLTDDESLHVHGFRDQEIA